MKYTSGIIWKDCTKTPFIAICVVNWSPTSSSPFPSQHLDNLLFMFIMKPLSFWRKYLLGSTHQHERLHRSISRLSIWLTSHPIALVVECLRFNLATKMSNNCITKKIFHAEDREFC